MKISQATIILTSIYGLLGTLIFIDLKKETDKSGILIKEKEVILDSLYTKTDQLQYTLDSIATSEPNCPEPIVINAKNGFEYLSMDTVAVPMSDDIAQILTLVKVIKQE